jgi:hypothetical protein
MANIAKSGIPEPVVTQLILFMLQCRHRSL